MGRHVHDWVWSDELDPRGFVCAAWPDGEPRCTRKAVVSCRVRMEASEKKFPGMGYWNCGFHHCEKHREPGDEPRRGSG